MVFAARIRTRSTAKQNSGEPSTEQVTVEQNELEKLWQDAAQQDRVYQGAKKTIEERGRRFPLSLGLKCSTEDYLVADNLLLYQGRRWVPDSERLRT